LNKDLSEAHSALCENKYYYEFDFVGAEAECKRAIALDPDSSLAREIYGRFLYHRGRFSEGIVEIKAAVDLEPASLFNQRNLGIAYYYSGRYEEAEAQLKRVIAMDQTFASAYMWLRNSLEMQQKHAEAYEWFIKGQKAIGTEERIVRLYETAYASSGYTGMMREHAKFADGYNQYYVGGILNAQVGDKDKAFEYLENSYKRREWGMNSLLIEPQLEPLRSDPRFKDLVKRVGLE
jgi:tetratricopeptide (TPR) repeat protein